MKNGVIFILLGLGCIGLGIVNLVFSDTALAIITSIICFTCGAIDIFLGIDSIINRIKK